MIDHPFETSGCGVAPFRVVGFETRTYRATPDSPAQPGAACDHCGTAIKHCYVIASTCGRRFVVGSRCVDQTADTGLLAGMKAVDKRRRAIAKIAKQRAECADFLTLTGALLWARPDVWGYVLDPAWGTTLRDHYSRGKTRELPVTRDVRIARFGYQLALRIAFKLDHGLARVPDFRALPEGYTGGVS